MSAAKLNEVPRAELEIHQGATLAFSVEWWEDDDETVPVVLAGADGMVADSNTDEALLLLDLGDYVSVDGNRATVSVPAADTLELPPGEGYVWDFYLESVAGETKKVGRGSASVRRMVG